MVTIAWFKADDGFHASHKVLSIPRSVRLSAVGLWTLAGTWSAAQELDGYVPDFMVTELGGTSRIVTALVKSGLWDEARDGGFQYRNWAEYQPTRADLEAGRAREAERKRKYRESLRPENVPPGHHPDGRGDTSGSPDTPTRPDPTRPLIDKTDKSSHLPNKAAQDSTDPDLAHVSRYGVDVQAVVAKVEAVYGQTPNGRAIRQVADAVMGRANNPKNPTAVLLTSIDNDGKDWRAALAGEQVKR